MRRSLAMPATLAAVLALALAGCDGSTTGSGGATSTTTATGSATVTTTTSGASSAPVSGDPAVAWMDKVCGEVVQLTEAQSVNPPNLSEDTGQALKSFDEYVSRNIGAVDETVNDLKNVGPAPVAGGDQALNELVTGLEALRKGYEVIKSRFASVNPNDPNAAQAAMIEAFNHLSQGGEDIGTAFESMASNPALKDAAAQAPNCQKLDVTPPTTTTS